MRRSEGPGLRWTGVDLPRWYLSIRQGVIAVGSQAITGDAPKSDHGDRAIDIGPKLVHERLGHHSTACTQSTCCADSHLLPGMGEAAARRSEELMQASDADGS